jgi:hypothetical protein
MSVFEKLKQARSEEDVKDIYIKELGLKGYSKSLIDIQTKEIWFEAKDGGKNSTYTMFMQLIHFVQETLNKGDYILPFRTLSQFCNLCLVLKKQSILLFCSNEQHVITNRRERGVRGYNRKNFRKKRLLSWNSKL